MRRILLTALVSLLVVSAGCVGLLTGETVEFEASEATVDTETVESTGYEESNTTEQELTREVTFAGQDRTIRIVNKLTQYRRSGSLAGVDIPELSQFIVLSTPGATVAGQTLNPAASWSNQRIVKQVSDQTGGISDIESDGNRSAESLGESRDIGMFTGTTKLGGQDVDVRIHVASFEHEGDVLIAVAVHPQRVSEDDNVDDLLAGIEHPGN